MQGLSNGRSDLFFVCYFIPCPSQNVVIPDPCAQECESEDAQWFPFAEDRDMVHIVNRESGHPMISHVMTFYNQEVRIKPREAKSVLPGRQRNSRIFALDFKELN
jgi:hypothetical protein